jgi:hypothetical protein
MTGLREVVHFSFPFLVHFCIPVDNAIRASILGQKIRWLPDTQWGLTLPLPAERDEASGLESYSCLRCLFYL